MMFQKKRSNLNSTLVTGANGFLGSEIVRQAIKADMVIRATDKDRTLPVSGIDYCSADILDINSLKPVMEGIGCVIHAAGLAHVFKESKVAQTSFKEINETGTKNVVCAAVQAGVAHFILISSVSIYGTHKVNAINEAQSCNPEGSYAQSKYLAEKRSIEIAQQSAMNMTILRLATAYGNGDPGNIGRLMRIIDRRRFVWIGSGLNRKSLIHREDVGLACLAVLKRLQTGIHIFNVSAPPCTMREVVERLTTELNRPIPHWHIPASLALNLAYTGKTLSFGHNKFRGIYATLKKWLEDDVYDSSKFEKTFRFKTQVSLSDGLRREVAWYLKQKTLILKH